jgi:HlyD family secretion protein
MIGTVPRIRLVVVPLAVLVAGYVAWHWRGGDTDRPQYVTAAVDRGPITAMVTATGTVNPVASVQVGTYVSGPIQAISADFNTPVQRGQLLAKIDPRPFQVKLDGATAELANARAQLEKDKADATLRAVTLRRTRDLRRQGIVSESDLDTAVSQDHQARAQVALAEAGVVAAEAKQREAQVNLAYTDIVSPVDGVVVSRNVDVGQTVAATFQTPTLFLVAEDLTRMQVGASVSESDIGRVAIDQAVAFSVDAYPGVTFDGRVSQVRNAPVTVQNVVTYDVVVSVDNADLRLKPGMTANVSITTASRPDALRIPTSALRFRPPADSDKAGAAAAADAPVHHGARVWVLDAGGRPRAVPVSGGIADDRFTEVTSGLQEGDRVIVALRRDPNAAPAAARAPSFAPARRPR